MKVQNRWNVLLFVVCLMSVSVPAFSASEVYEEPAMYAAEDMLLGVPAHGENYFVKEDVYNDGFMNHYVIYSDHGVFEAVGDRVAKQRIAEMQALDALDNIGHVKAYLGGIKEAATGTLTTAADAVSQPVTTVKNLPGGVARYFGNLGRLATGSRGETEGGALSELVGFAGVQRELAFELGVDPYTTNEVLQRELRITARGLYAGGLTLKAAGLALPKEARIAISATQWGLKFSTMLRDESPESLQKINRDRMKALNMPTWVADQLLRNPYLSPSQTTAIVDAMNDMMGVANMEIFAQRAAGAMNFEEAEMFTTQALMYRYYHLSVARLTSFIQVASLPWARSTNGAVVYMASIDYGVWTQQLATVSNNVARSFPSDVKEAKKELWLMGRVSEMTEANLAELGIAVVEQVNPVVSE